MSATAIEAKLSRGYWIRVAIMGVICAPMTIGCLAAAVGNARSRYSHGVTGVLLWIGLALIAGTIPAWMVLGKGTWVRRFDERGVALRNGRRLEWSELERVVTVQRLFHGRRTGVDHYRLYFRGGVRAQVNHLMLANGAEVAALVESLQHGRNPFVAARGGRS